MATTGEGSGRCPAGRSLRGQELSQRAIFIAKTGGVLLFYVVFFVVFRAFLVFIWWLLVLVFWALLNGDFAYLTFIGQFTTGRSRILCVFWGFFGASGS